MHSQHLDSVLVRVEGDTRLLGASVLRDLAEAVDLITCGMEEGDWFISDLSLGSYALCTTPVQRNPQAMDKLVHIVDRIANYGELPNPSDKLVSGLKKLGNLSKNQHVHEISIGLTTSPNRIEIPTNLSDLVDAALAPSVISIGSAIGVIDRLTTRDKLEFGLIDETSQTPVTVTFDRAQLPLVKELMNQRIYARGELEYDSKGVKKHLRLHDIEEYPLSCERVSFAQVLDAFKDVRFNASTEEIMRGLRG